MNHVPLVSVGLPVYNGENYISYAIESVLAQTFADFELVISDNCSTDSTEQICRRYASMDSRVRYFRNAENIGASGNFRRVFELSRGRYFKWTGHDDISAPELLEKLTCVLENNSDIILCYSRTTRIDAAGNPTTNGYSDGLDLREDDPVDRLRHFYNRFKKNTYCEPAFGLVRREVLEKTTLIGNYVAADEIMLAELALRGKFFEVEDSLFYRRIHPAAAGHANRSVKDLAAWYDPKNRSKQHRKRWKMLKGYIEAVKRVPLSKKDRILCHYQVALWALRHYRGLTYELIFHN